MLDNKIRVVFYLKKDDKELLDNQSKLIGVSTSNYIRNCVLEQLGKPIYNPPKIDFNTKEYMVQLLRIGNNLNQISRRLNAGNKFVIADQQEVLNDLELLKNQLLQVKSELSNNGK